MRRTVLLLSLLLTAAQPVAAQAPAAQPVVVTIGALRIETPWMRQPPDGARVAGGFLRITNTGKEADRLISGSAPFAKRFELHDMVMDGSVMRMRELANGLEIKPGQTVELKPGGLHVMYMDIIETPKAGEARKTTLVFEKAGTIELNVAVMPRGHTGGAAKGGHGH